MTPTEIRALRHRLGWTLEQMASALSVTTSAVGHWERGLNAPHPLVTATLHTWAQRLDQINEERRRAAVANLLAAVTVGGALALLAWLTQPHEES